MRLGLSVPQARIEESTCLLADLGRKIVAADRVHHNYVARPKLEVVVVEWRVDEDRPRADGAENIREVPQ
jgi:hypothetical protein